MGSVKELVGDFIMCTTNGLPYQLILKKQQSIEYKLLYASSNCEFLDGQSFFARSDMKLDNVENVQVHLFAVQCTIWKQKNGAICYDNIIFFVLVLVPER